MSRKGLPIFQIVENPTGGSQKKVGLRDVT